MDSEVGLETANAQPQTEVLENAVLLNAVLLNAVPQNAVPQNAVVRCDQVNPGRRNQEVVTRVGVVNAQSPENPPVAKVAAVTAEDAREVARGAAREAGVVAARVVPETIAASGYHQRRPRCNCH